MDDIEFIEWHLRCGRVEVSNGGNDDADNERAPNKAQHMPQLTADPYPPVEGC